MVERMNGLWPLGDGDAGRSVLGKISFINATPNEQ